MSSLAIQSASRLRRIRSSGVQVVASHAGNLKWNDGSVPVLAQRGQPASNELRVLDEVRDISPSLAAILRPQAAYRWLLPYLASITPQYVEGVLRGALAGNHVQAWELFDLMMDSDPEISACVQEYNEGVLKKKFLFTPYAEEDEEPSDTAVEKCKVVSAALRNMRPDMTCDENDLRGTVRDILAARFHGQSLLEVEWQDALTEQLRILEIPNLGQVACPRSTFWVHPVCYAWDMNGKLGLRTALTDTLDETRAALAVKTLKQKPYSLVEPPAWNWITSQPKPSMLSPFPRNKFLIGIHKGKTGTVLGSSILRPLAFWWVASNFCGDWLLTYAELFGIPFRKATYKPGIPDNIKLEIKQMLQSMGSTGYALLPEGANLDLVEGGSNAGQSPQAFLFSFANEMKRKVILHQTMTGGQNTAGTGAGKGGMDTESDVKDDCIAEGARYAESVINLQLVPMILEMNYGDGGDMEAPTVKLVDDTVGGLQDAQRDQILSNIMDVPTSYMHRKYGVPKPGDDDALAGQEAGVTGSQQEFQRQQYADAQDVQRQQMENQHEVDMEIAKHPQVQNQNGAPPNGQPAGGAKGAGEKEQKGTGAQAARAVSVNRVRVALEAAASKAFAETVGPLVKRLKAIDRITDLEAKQAALEKFIKDAPSIESALKKDSSLSDATLAEAMKSFLKGLKSKPK
ncbi:MAG: DUF935 family protein [Patescibacteria group bacterium]|nr:DUF935 family protein [Patescibacteria group bacterium]